MILFISTSLARPVPPDSLLNQNNRAWTLHPQIEIGTLAPLSHQIKLGREGTDFNYIKDGGQDNLFRYTRWEMEFRNNRHSYRFLFQPLDLTTRAVAKEDLLFDYTSFVAGTPMTFRYGFDYYRASYSYDLLEEEDKDLFIGCSMQIRNATLDFRSLNGDLMDSNRDIGPVPLLKIQGRYELPNARWWGFEADGSYAPIKYLNGDVSDVVGAILDSSVRGGFKLKSGIDTYLNLRYVGGGAEGTESEPDPGKDGYVENWLHVMSFSIGFLLR